MSHLFHAGHVLAAPMIKASMLKAGVMKCSALALALVVGWAATPAHAQQPAASVPAAPAISVPPPSHMQAARDVVVLSGVSNSFTNIFAEFSASLRQTLLTRPETRKDLEEVLVQIKPESDKRIEDMTNVASVVFALRMTEADLKEVVAFFNSPVGRRYNSTRPQMINEVYTQLQPWTYRTSDFLYNTARDEMKKRGHDIGG